MSYFGSVGQIFEQILKFIVDKVEQLFVKFYSQIYYITKKMI